MLKTAQCLLFCAIFTSVGCATEPKPVYNVDPALAPYVGVFEQVYQQKAEFNVILVRSANYLAWCQKGSRTIGVDMEFFLRATEDQIEEVILHEFGHCKFNREHNDAQVSSGPMIYCPVSIMTSKVLASNSHCYQSFREYYLHELNHPQTQ